MPGRRFTLTTPDGVEDLGVLDERRLTISDGYLIQNATGGWPLKKFFEGIQDIDPKALQALVWFLRFKKGQQVRIESVDFNILDLDAEDVDVVDPTPVPAGTDETSTLPLSPVTSD